MPRKLKRKADHTNQVSLFPPDIFEARKSTVKKPQKKKNETAHQPITLIAAPQINHELGALAKCGTRTQDSSSNTRATTPINSSSPRIAAIHLPQVLCEMALDSKIVIDSSHARHSPPLGVIVVQSDSDQVRATDPLVAVCPKAQRAGLRPGQSSTEACALIANLRIETLTRFSVMNRLTAIAEVLKSYGTTTSWEYPDTIWLDVSGVAHLFGGEKKLAEEIHEQVRLLGHVVRVVIAPGPQIAQAIAKHTPQGIKIVEAHDTQKAMRDLPLSALPLDKEHLNWLSRLGLFSIGQLGSLPAKAFSTRLGKKAMHILELAQGVDPTPLVAGQFPNLLTEEKHWDDGAEGISPLLFATNGLVASLSARLCGRGEATALLEIELEHDRAICSHRGIAQTTTLQFELATPLFRESDLQRVIKSRLEGLSLRAPTCGIRLRAKQLTPQQMDQLGLSLESNSGYHYGFNSENSHQLPVVLAELQADVGNDCIGTLHAQMGHRPETHSTLMPLKSATLRAKPKKTSSSSRAKALFSTKSQKKQQNLQLFDEIHCPAMRRITRILQHPHDISTNIQIGECFGVGSELYTIENLRFIQRLDRVEWWTPQTISRDYLWAWLQSPRGGTEALLYFDRIVEKSYLQAFAD